MAVKGIAAAKVAGAARFESHLGATTRPRPGCRAPPCAATGLTKQLRRRHPVDVGPIGRVWRSRFPGTGALAHKNRDPIGVTGERRRSPQGSLARRTAFLLVAGTPIAISRAAAGKTLNRKPGPRQFPLPGAIIPSARDAGTPADRRLQTRARRSRSGLFPWRVFPDRKQSGFPSSFNRQGSRSKGQRCSGADFGAEDTTNALKQGAQERGGVDARRGQTHRRFRSPTLPTARARDPDVQGTFHSRRSSMEPGRRSKPADGPETSSSRA